jgi:hypothetical protein
MNRKDYIERLIEQFAQALARILKARQEARYEDALGLIREAARTALGMEYGPLTRVDAASTARMLGDPERVGVLGRLVAQEAEVLQARGEVAGAEDRFRLGLELLLEARALGWRMEGEGAEALATLRARVDPGALSERYRGLLARA